MICIGCGYSVKAGSRCAECGLVADGRACELAWRALRAGALALVVLIPALAVLGEYVAREPGGQRSWVEMVLGGVLLPMVLASAGLVLHSSRRVGATSRANESFGVGCAVVGAMAGAAAASLPASWWSNLAMALGRWTPREALVLLSATGVFWALGEALGGLARARGGAGAGRRVRWATRLVCALYLVVLVVRGWMNWKTWATSTQPGPFGAVVHHAPAGLRAIQQWAEVLALMGGALAWVLLVWAWVSAGLERAWVDEDA